MRIARTAFLVVLETSLVVASIYLFWLSRFGAVVDVQFAGFLILYMFWVYIRFRRYNFIRMTSMILTVCLAVSYVFYYETHTKENLIERLVAEGVCMPTIRFPELNCS